VTIGLGLAQLIRVVVPALPVATPILYVLLAVASSAVIGLAPACCRRAAPHGSIGRGFASE